MSTIKGSSEKRFEIGRYESPDGFCRLTNIVKNIEKAGFVGEENNNINVHFPFGKNKNASEVIYTFKKSILTTDQLKSVNKRINTFLY